MEINGALEDLGLGNVSRLAGYAHVSVNIGLLLLLVREAVR